MDQNITSMMEKIAFSTHQLTLLDPHLQQESLTEHIRKAMLCAAGDVGALIRDAFKGMEVLNSAGALPDFEKCITVFDFFTYCCINCMHVLPDLEAIEDQFGSHVNVIGIHSAKFENEKSNQNILSAIRRYGIKHPVVNDKDCNLWRICGIKCWPTIGVFGPGLVPLVICSGEGHRKLLVDTITIALQAYQTPISADRTIAYRQEIRQERRPKGLFFPGKVAIGADGDLIVSDTGNHRVIVTDREGKVRRIFGSGRRGFRDGTSAEAELNQPQGTVSLPDGRIIVADTGNHRIRMIDVDDSVTTLVGTGEQGRDLIGGNAGTEQPIASPWDVATYRSREDLASPDVLLIAMAGSHQIWGYFFEDTVWWKNKTHKRGTCAALVGSGMEENRNNSYPHKVGLAQPSGLAVNCKQKALYVADSESSTIRRISLVDGSCKGVCGGERDPTNLFAYGDLDGPSTIARLQHPLAVAMHGSDILVADSYNHKIKLISKPLAKDSNCENLMGTGQREEFVGGFLETGLNEPGGMAMDHSEDTLYIADTNHHRILKASFKSRTIEEVHFTFSSPTPVADHSDLIQVQPYTGVIQFEISLKPGQGVKLNSEPQSDWKLTVASSSHNLNVTKSPSVSVSELLALPLASSEIVKNEGKYANHCANSNSAKRESEMDKSNRKRPEIQSGGLISNIEKDNTKCAIEEADSDKTRSVNYDGEMKENEIEKADLRSDASLDGTALGKIDLKEEVQNSEQVINPPESGTTASECAEEVHVQQWHPSENRLSANVRVLTNQSFDLRIGKVAIGCTADTCVMKEVDLRFRVKTSRAAESLVTVEQTVFVE